MLDVRASLHVRAGAIARRSGPRSEVGVIEVRRASPGRNRTNAAWLREQLTSLLEEIRRRCGENRALTTGEIDQRLSAMLEGEEPQR
jgi:hypothetical protein